MRVAILGAGPAGLSAASYLARLEEVEGENVYVFDEATHLGGLQRSFEYEGVHFDVGTILFAENHGMLEAFPFLRNEMVPIKYRPVSITPAGSYDRYPFTVKGYIRDNGIASAAQAAFEVLYSKFRYAAKDSVEAYARYYMGGSVYKKSGLQNYIYRLHNLPDSKLDVEFARKRLNLIERQSIRRMISSSLPTGKKKTVAGPRLVRPSQGFPYMYDELIRPSLEELGIQLCLGTKPTSVRRNDDHFEVVFSSGKTQQFDRLVSTIPIPSMLELLGETPQAQVQTKNLISLFYTGKFKNPGNTFFNFTLESEWKRITVFSKFYKPLPNGEDFFTVEITTDDDIGDERVATVASDFERHAEKFGLLESKPNLHGSHISIDAYPVYQDGEMDAIEEEKQRLKSQGVDLLGRQGNFEYVVSNIVARRAKELSETWGRD